MVELEVEEEGVGADEPHTTMLEEMMMSFMNRENECAWGITAPLTAE